MLLNYLILKSLIGQTLKAVQTPSAFKLPYKSFRFIPFPKNSTAIWKRLCFLHSVGFVSLESNKNEWYISVNEKGFMFVLDCKVQFVKGLASVALAITSAMIGFLAGLL